MHQSNDIITSLHHYKDDITNYLTLEMDFIIISQKSSLFTETDK